MALPLRALLGLPVILSLLGMLFPSVLGHAQQFAAAPESANAKESLLLLNNGQVLRGAVSLDGDRYIVHSGSSEVHVPRDSVEHVCRSLEEGYQRKRTAVLAAGGRHRTRLIQWCLAQQLLDEAEQELAEAKHLEPNNLRYDLLRRQLKLARQPVQPAPAPAPLPEPPVSDAHLDIFVRTLPGSAVESFSQTVQPLLLNNCAAAGCHGPSPRSDFQLIRLSRGVTPSRRVTQRNLHSTLAWINRENPDQSRILTAAAQAHGNTQKQKFEGADGPVFRHLAAWVSQVAQPANPVLPPTLESNAATLSQSIADSDTPRSPSPSNTPRRNPAPRGVAGPLDRSQSKTTTAPTRQPSPAATMSDPEPPADPFDPEAFNRRYHPEEDEDKQPAPP